MWIFLAKEKNEKVTIFKISEIPDDGCVIKDNYVICKENGEIKVSRVKSETTD